MTSLSLRPDAPRPFATRVEPGWIDYNGHVTDAAYAHIAALANEELCVDIGMSEDYRHGTGRAWYSAQLTIRYRHEIGADAEVQVRRTITQLGAKSMTVASEFQVDGRTVATTEHVYVLVDARVRSSVPVDHDERSRIEPWIGQAW